MFKAFGKGETFVDKENAKNNEIVPSTIDLKVSSNVTVSTANETVSEEDSMEEALALMRPRSDFSAVLARRHQQLQSNQETMLSNQDTMKAKLNEVKEGQQDLLTILASPNPKKAAAAALAKRTPLPKSSRKKLPTTSSKKPRGSSRHQERFTSAAKDKATSIKPAF